MTCVRCVRCESRIPPNAGIESPFAAHEEGTMYCNECIATPRVAFVGCGAAKLETDEPVEARELYTSNYFRLKREYAETTCDGWAIISAEHGLLSPYEEIEPYDTTITDLSEYELGKWSVRTSNSISTTLINWNITTTAVLLMGENYLEHIEERAFDPIRSVERPFEGSSGIGDQMGLLRRAIDRYHPGGQSDLEHFGAVATDGGREGSRS
jgi:hypothetical protein